MRKSILCILLMVSTAQLGFAQDAKLKEKLSEYFFGLPVGADFDSLKQMLLSNPDFKRYSDPNRDANNSIVGSISQSKMLNPIAIRNQVILLSEPQSNKTKAKVSLKWSIDYKLEDLAIALVDCDQIKSSLKPLFRHSTQKLKIGYHQEEIESLYLKQGMMAVTIRMMKFNNSSHTISVECTYLRRKK